jgi:D-Tyr-tRNAtyr deacylase
MRRNFIRYLSAGTVVVALAAAAGVSAFAASSNRGHQFGPRGGLTIHGFGPGFGFAFGFPGGPGFGFKVGGGGGVTYADVLTPAADYLGVSLSTLQSDLKGGKTLAQEATAKGKTASDLIDAIVKAETKVLDAQKAAGWLTDAQETALLDNFKSEVTELVNNGPGVPPVGLQNNGPLQTAADYLGISVSDLMADLKAGKTLAQEATAKGKTVDGLVKALLDPLKTKLDKSVAAGDITAAQETTILNRATTALTNLVNNTKPDKLQAGLRQAGLRLALPRLFFLHR